MLGKIHSFQSLGTLDGPGIRYIIFMHGCNLHCGYCHNVDVCKGDYKEYSADEIIGRVVRFKEYFSDEGGITISGGEPLLQAEFLNELFDLCKENGIKTCIDTSGSLWNEEINKLLDKTDLVLLDIKMTDDELYQKHIGCPIDKPLNFLNKIQEKGKRCWIRYVVVQGLNDSEDEIRRLKKLCDLYNCIDKIELLPFKKICKTKYVEMNMEFPFDIYSETSQEIIDKLYKILR